MNGGEENRVESILLLSRYAPSQLQGTVCKKMLLIICGFRDHMKNFSLGEVMFLLSQQTVLPCIHLD